MSYLHARTAEKVLTVQLLREKLRREKSEVVERDYAIEQGFAFARRLSGCLGLLAGAGRSPDGGGPRGGCPQTRRDSSPHHVREQLKAWRERNSISTAHDYEGNRAFLRSLIDGLKPDPPMTVAEWADSYRILSGGPRPRPGGTGRRARLTCARSWTRSRPRPGRADRVHEGGAGRGDGSRQQLDRLRHPPGAGTDAGGAADGGAGQAQLAAAHRSADRGKSRAAEDRGAGPLPRQRQHDAVEGVPRRHAGADRRQRAAGLRSMPARYMFLDEVDAYPAEVDDEGDPVALAEARTAPSGTAGSCSWSRRRRSRACRGSSGSTRPPTSGGTSCPARTAERCSGCSSSGCAGRRASPRRRSITARPATSRSEQPRPRCWPGRMARDGRGRRSADPGLPSLGALFAGGLDQLGRIARDWEAAQHKMPP